MHYVTVIWVEMNGRLVNAKFNLLKILLDPGSRSSTILGKNMQKLRKK